MLRAYLEIIEDGRTYRYAEPVAQRVAERLVEATDTFADIDELEAEIGEAEIVFAGATDDGRPSVLKWASEFRGTYHLSRSVVEAGLVIHRVCDSYAEFWSADLQKQRWN